MGLIQEFKEFSIKGNVVDLAVGVIIGGAFGKIVTSVVNDLIMPPIGLLVNGLDFKNIKVVLKEAIKEGDKVIKPELTLNIGNFIQTSVDFLIVSFCIFAFVKVINKMKRKQEESETPVPETKPADTILLEEIRDLLKDRTK